MDTEKWTNSHQELPKWSPKHCKIEPKTRPNRGAARVIFRKRGVRTAKNSNKNIDPSKKRGRHHSVPPFWPKKLPTWRQVGFQNRAKINRKSMQEPTKKLMHFTIDFQIDFGGFLERKWKHVAPKSYQKLAFSENVKNAFGASPLVPNWVRGIQHESKNRTKMIWKWSQLGKPSWQRFLIDLIGFWEATWRGKSSQDRSKMAS